MFSVKVTKRLPGFPCAEPHLQAHILRTKYLITWNILKNELSPSAVKNNTNKKRMG